MVLKNCAVIFAITTLSTIHLTGAFNFYHNEDSEFTLPEKVISDLRRSSQAALSLSRADDDVETIESLEADELEASERTWNI